MDGLKGTAPRRCRAVWISDVHLGFAGCSAELLLAFLHSVQPGQLYLVGDIIDLWALKKKPFWPGPHDEVLRAILGKARQGTRVIYVPGNHDERLREYDGMVFGNVSVRNQAVHTRADGRKLLVLHGDQFDAVVKCSPLAALIGSALYEWLLRANTWVNALRRRLDLPYWSLAAFLKHRVKNAVQYISNFERAVAHAARSAGVQGVVCGHIHRAEISDIDGIAYYNCGDWVESCTALVETLEGRMELVHWAESAARRDPGLARAA